MSGWEDLAESDKKERKDKSKITKADIKEQFDKSRKSSGSSSVCAVVYGEDGTGKTGGAIDCRTDKEIEEGKLIIVFDLDDGAGVIKDQYWAHDENIVVLSPIEMLDNGDIDYIGTYDRLKTQVGYVKTEVPEEDIKAVIFDGLDSLKKLAEFAWKLSEGMKPSDKPTNTFDWQKRNLRYQKVIIPLKNMKCDRFFITHMKDKKGYKDVGGSSQLVTLETIPDWLSGTPGMMTQKIHCERETDNHMITLKATLEKSKHDLSREGEEVVIATVNKKKNKTEWNDHAFHKLLFGDDIE